LTPVARLEGSAFVNSAFGDKPQKINYEYVSSAVFARPEAATVGIMESKGITKQDLDDTIGIHPTTAEEFLTLD
jgi:glutathione reductase (NADPH)